MARDSKNSTTQAVNRPAVSSIPLNTAVTGRHEYLQWVNGSLNMQLKCIEELCTG